MPEPATILTTLGGLAKIAGDMAAAKDEVERNKLLIEFQKSVIAANFQVATLQQDVSTLKGTIEDLKRETMRQEDWERESKRYALYDPGFGVAVRALKESMSNGEPPHYLCANCFNDGKKTVLYFGHIAGNRNHHDEALFCKSCKTESPTGYSGGSKPKYPPDS
jgi:hypothetical protein